MAEPLNCKGRAKKARASSLWKWPSAGRGGRPITALGYLSPARYEEIHRLPLDKTVA